MQQPNWAARLESILASLPEDPSKRFAIAFKNGTMRTLVYAPKGEDLQEPHAQDEVYFVAQGTAEFIRGEERLSVTAGDALFVPAWTQHRFDKLSDDLAVWVIFYDTPQTDPRYDSIDTREELVNALVEAAELEHGLLIQYLFAAFSLKRRLDEGLTPLQRETAIQWERSLLQVCHEEMFHLAHVNNLLTAIGAAPWLGRPNFPQQGERYPEPFRFGLERFCLTTIGRFVLYELPVDEPLPDDVRSVLFPDKKAAAIKLMAAPLPEPLTYSSVGGLYASIANAFSVIPEGELFLSPDSQVAGEWGLRTRRAPVFKVYDRASALRAIAQIVENGEGTQGARAGSHYEIFLEMFRALKKAQDDDARFDVARAVCRNPALRSLPAVSGDVSMLTHPAAVATASLFDGVYGAMLMMLLEGFAPAAPNANAERIELVRISARRLMSAAIRPLAEVLTRLPAFADGSGNAGPPFGTYGPLLLSTLEANRWPFLRERLERQISAAEEVGKLLAAVVPDEMGRLARAKDVLEWTLERLEEASGGQKLPMAVAVEPPDSHGYAIEIIFSGWMQVRLATDPDPADEPRGVSGYVAALPTEPDLDRIIRFQPPFEERTYGPALGVTVESVKLDGVSVADHPLVTAAVNLEGQPVFKGENGVVAEDGLEPIVPFVLSITRDEKKLFQRGTAKSPDHVQFPFASLQATSIGPASLALLSRAGLSDPSAHLLQRAERLRARLQDEKDPVARAGIETRVKVLERVGASFYGFQMTWRVQLAAAEAIAESEALPGVAVYTGAPWVVELAIGCWDPDIQCSFVLGSMWLPGWRVKEDTEQRTTD